MLNNNSLPPALLEKAKRYFDGQDPAHDWYHNLRAILAHRFRKNNPPITLEEKILFDADKLDSIGAVGVARAFAYSGVIGQPIQSGNPDQHTPAREYERKLRLLQDRLFTATAKEIAEERHRFMELFFAQWESELRGAL